jgi:3-oxoacyl-[acyl-carrier-protein] synthase-3
MIGIGAIAVEIPATRVSNLDRADRFNATESFVRDKLGFLEVARKAPEEETSDLCVTAARRLFEGGVSPDGIECAVVVTQNPDGHGLPHTAAIVHRKLGLPSRCLTFDISLGCSGYVAGLAAVGGTMQALGMRRGLLFTADPYSKILNQADRDTELLFGDAATVTELTDAPRWNVGEFDFGTRGDLCDAIRVGEDGRLSMNGRAVLTFAAVSAPESILRALERNGLAPDQVDRYLVHPGSKYMVDVIAERLGAHGPIPFCARHYGNTVSSSLPLALSSELAESDRVVVLSGFGVGLCWATTVLRRVE